MSLEGATPRDPGRGYLGKSLWSPLEAPQARPGFLSCLLASGVTAFVAWLVLSLLVGAAFVTGLLVSDGLKPAEFYDRMNVWVELVVFPLTGAIYAVGIRAFTSWFANRLIGWPDAIAALAIAAVATGVLARTGLEDGVVAIGAGCLLVAGYLRLRTGPTASAR